jgi:hypothetical protein
MTPDTRRSASGCPPAAAGGTATRANGDRGDAGAARVAARQPAREPEWLDTRLVLGVLLVLVSVVVGARVLSAADRSQLVWTTRRDLAPGTELTADDVVAARVRLFDNAERYLSAEQPRPVGYLLDRALGADELLPRDGAERAGQRARLPLRHRSTCGRATRPPDLRSR